jgi:hypothetical protein
MKPKARVSFIKALLKTATEGWEEALELLMTEGEGQPGCHLVSRHRRDFEVA